MSSFPGVILVRRGFSWTVRAAVLVTCCLIIIHVCLQRGLSAEGLVIAVLKTVNCPSLVFGFVPGVSSEDVEQQFVVFPSSLRDTVRSAMLTWHRRQCDDGHDPESSPLGVCGLLGSVLSITHLSSVSDPTAPAPQLLTGSGLLTPPKAGHTCAKN